MTTPRTAATRRLNSEDRAALVNDDVLRAAGHPGMTCQTQVWFDGTVDADRLRSALDRLADVHPVLLGRLVRPWRFHRTRWRFPVSEAIPLEGEDRPGDGRATILERASDAFGRPIDLESQPAIRFHLLKGVEGGDVLLMTYSHVLMDGTGPETLLGDLARIDRGEAVPSPDLGGQRDEVADGLRRHSRWSRARRHVRDLVRRARERRYDDRVAPPVLLGRSDGPGPVTGRLRIAVRWLGPAAVEALHGRSREILGFDYPTPVLLAGAFRAVRGISAPADPAAELRVHLPISLRSAFPGPVRPVCNLTSFVPVRSRYEELADFDGLVRALFRRIRAGLRRGDDLAWSEMFRLVGRSSNPAIRAIIRAQKHSSTMTFGYMGRATAEIELLLGTGIRAFHALTAPGRMPALAVNELDGRLCLGMSYMTEAIAPEEVEAFLDAFVDDVFGSAVEDAPAAG